MLDRVEANEPHGHRGRSHRTHQARTGRPLLLLHPAIGIKPTDRVIDELARSFAVLAPSHPGFGEASCLAP